MEEVCFKILRLFKRLYRPFLKLIKAGLGCAGVVDINNTYALMVSNTGKAKLLFGVFTNRRYYILSNVLHNQKKMTESGYIEQL